MAPPTLPVTARRAVIDVGTNSVKLLVADLTGAEVQPVLEQSEQTRLGAGFFQTHQLQPGAIADTARAVADFATLARRHGAAGIRVIATSAARDARNATELTDAIHTAAGLVVEVISGAQEADWAFQGVTSGPALARLPLLLLDVGGGSTEFILGCAGRQSFRHSYQLGTVRLLEGQTHADPPGPTALAECRRAIREFLVGEVLPRLGPALAEERGRRQAADAPVALVGTGGSSTILARMRLQQAGFDREAIENTRLSLADIRELVERLWNQPLAERQKIPGLPPNRADVILPGCAIYEGIMTTFDFAELRVSTRGLRFAAVMDEPGGTG